MYSSEEMQKIERSASTHQLSLLDLLIVGNIERAQYTLKLGCIRGLEDLLLSLLLFKDFLLCATTAVVVWVIRTTQLIRSMRRAMRAKQG